MGDRSFRLVVVGLLAAIVLILAVTLLPKAGLLRTGDSPKLNESAVAVARLFWDGMASGNRESVASLLDDSYQGSGFLLTLLKGSPNFVLGHLTLLGIVTESGPVALLKVEVCREGLVSDPRPQQTVEQMQLRKQSDGSWRVAAIEQVSSDPVGSILSC